MKDIGIKFSGMHIQKNNNYFPKIVDLHSETITILNDKNELINITVPKSVSYRISELLSKHSNNAKYINVVRRKVKSKIDYYPVYDIHVEPFKTEQE